MSKPIKTGAAADYVSAITALYTIIKSNAEYNTNIINNYYYKIYNDDEDKLDIIDTKIYNYKDADSSDTSLKNVDSDSTPPEM